MLRLEGLWLRDLPLDLGFQVCQRQLVRRGALDVERNRGRSRIESVGVYLDEKFHDVVLIYIYYQITGLL